MSEAESGSARPAHETTILDGVAGVLRALGTALVLGGRHVGEWLNRQRKLVWVDREILALRERRGRALTELGECLYGTFRAEAMGRPELMQMIAQIAEMDTALARKQRLRERIERD